MTMMKVLGRPAKLLWGQDFDCSGVDIKRDFIKRTHNVWDPVITVGVLHEHVAQYDLLENPAKETDKRLPAFIAEYGVSIQVELEALAPEDLRALYQAALDEDFDQAAYDAVLAEEEVDKAYLRSLLRPEAA